ncbi:MAG: hypothetical protein HY717_20350 [Planctomycetes bacterium]|nr:hypothetical protein [Planctomycetota bacterium]
MNKPFTKMTASELADATREFDKPSPPGRFRPMTARERRQWERAKRGRGRPSKAPGQKAVRVLLTIQPTLLAEADAFARRHGLSRSDLFARGLRIVFAAAGLISPRK